MAVVYLMLPPTLLLLFGIRIFYRWRDDWRLVAIIPAALFLFAIFSLWDMSHAREFAGFGALGRYIFAIMVAYVSTGVLVIRHAADPKSKTKRRKRDDGEAWYGGQPPTFQAFDEPTGRDSE